MRLIIGLLAVTLVPLAAKNIALTRALYDGVDALDAGDYQTAMTLIRDAVAATEEDCAAPVRSAAYIRRKLVAAMPVLRKGEQGQTYEVLRRLAGCHTDLEDLATEAHFLRRAWDERPDAWALYLMGPDRPDLTLDSLRPPRERIEAIERAAERGDWHEAARLSRARDW